jgi:hypothetical protein
MGRDVEGLPAGGKGGVDVVGIAVADVEDGSGRKGEGTLDGAEGGGVRLFEAEFAGNEEVVEMGRPIELGEDLAEAGVPVGEDGEGEFTRMTGEGGEDFMRAGEGLPAAGAGKFVPELSEDGFEEVRGAFGGDGAADNFTPEGEFGGFVDERAGLGAEVGEGVAEAGFEDGGVEGEVVTREDFGIDGADAWVRVEKGAADVEGDSADAGEVDGGGGRFHATAQRARRERKKRRGLTTNGH